jgi:hypothetical protein
MMWGHWLHPASTVLKLTVGALSKHLLNLHNIRNPVLKAHSQITQGFTTPISLQVINNFHMFLDFRRVVNVE